MVRFTSHSIIYFDYIYVFSFGFQPNNTFCASKTLFYFDQLPVFGTSTNSFVPFSACTMCLCVCVCNHFASDYMWMYRFVGQIVQMFISSYHIYKIHANIHRDQIPFYINIISIFSVLFCFLFLIFSLCSPFFFLFFPHKHTFTSIDFVLFHIVYLYQNQFRVL